MEQCPAIQTEEAQRNSAQGDDAAFADIVREHQGMVFSIAYHFLRNRAVAEDLAQEVFLELYRNLARIESPAHLRYWLRRVTVHRCIDQGRKQRPELGLEEMPEPSTTDGANDPLLSKRLRRTVASLPERQRIMVVLRYQEELALEEISQLLDVPVNTVKSTLHRALAALRRKLTRDLGGIRYALFGR